MVGVFITHTIGPQYKERLPNKLTVDEYNFYKNFTNKETETQRSNFAHGHMAC